MEIETLVELPPRKFVRAEGLSGLERKRVDPYEAVVTALAKESDLRAGFLFEMVWSGVGFESYTLLAEDAKQWLGNDVLPRVRESLESVFNYRIFSQGFEISDWTEHEDETYSATVTYKADIRPAHHPLHRYSAAVHIFEAIAYHATRSIELVYALRKGFRPVFQPGIPVMCWGDDGPIGTMVLGGTRTDERRGYLTVRGISPGQAERIRYAAQCCGEVE